MVDKDTLKQPPTLEQREAKARIKKLKLEARILSVQLSPKYDRRELLKTLAGLGGLLAAFAAVGTLLFSTWRSRQEAFDARQVKVEERFDRALENLGRDSAGSRLGGVVSLKSFLTAKDSVRHSRALLSLSHALAIERDPIVRDAIVEVFSSINVSAVTRSKLDDALNSLIGLNRAFYREGKLNRTSTSEVSVDSLAARAQSNGLAIIALLKRGARTDSLSGIYCERCDFSGMNLRSVNFDDSILRLANFTNATLDEASFNRADLENANFRNAHLRDANFKISGMPWYQQQWSYRSDDKTLYSWDNLQERRVWVNFPNFYCADLRGADFSGRVLGAFIDEYWNFAGFLGADLEGAKLLDSGVVFASAKKSFMKGMGYSATEGFTEHNQTYQIYRVGLDAATSETGPGSDILEALAVTFEGANWQHALLPNGLIDRLKGYRKIPRRLNDECRPAE